ncbi:unnamed protein product, partial [Mesorhabditis spiculigera]
MRLLALFACFEVYFVVTEAARPGQSCSSVIHCEGDSVCIEGYCLCVEGMKKLQELCVEPIVLELADRNALTPTTTAKANLFTLESRVADAYKAKAKASTPKPFKPIYNSHNGRPNIGLAGGKCGIGGLCRALTTCQRDVCVCYRGFRAAFGECVRDKFASPTESTTAAESRFRTSF